MEIELVKESSIRERFTQISSLLTFITQQLTEEENKLIKENLIYDKLLNKQLKAKKVLTHNYAKSNAERKQALNQSNNTQPDIHTLPVEVFENKISENILSVIQKAEIALQDINDEPKPKFQKPAISPYEQPKAPIKKPPFGSGLNSKNQQTQMKETQVKKQPLGRYVLHKQPTMQTTYSSNFNNKSASQRSSSNYKSDLTAQTQSSAARKNSVNARNQTSHANSLNVPNISEIPNQRSGINKTQGNVKNNLPLSQKQQTEQLNSNTSINEKNSSSDLNNTSSSTNASSKTSTKLAKPIESVQTPNTIQNVNQSQNNVQQTLETFKEDNDLFENMNRNDLSQYYQGKKSLHKCQKEYQQQQKYYKEKEGQARYKFLNKLTSHFRERHLVTQGKLIQYEQMKNGEKIQNNKNNNNKKHDKYAEENEQDEENKQQIDSFYEYTFLQNNNDSIQIQEENKYFNKLSKITNTMTALIEYASIILQNINLNNNSEEIIFLKEIKDNQINLNSCNQDLCLLFRIWYFIKNLENNYAIFCKINQDTLQQISSYSKYFSETYFPNFIGYERLKENNTKQKTDEQSIKILKFRIEDQGSIGFIEDIVQNKSEHLQINELNKTQINVMMADIIDKFIIQQLQQELLNNINQNNSSTNNKNGGMNKNNINLKQFSGNLKLIRTLSSILQFHGKIQPSFFFTNSISNYFAHVTEQQ